MRKIQSNSKNPFAENDVLTKAIPAPTDGWDALSPLALMDPKRSPILINWVPRPGWVELRAGYLPWSEVSTLPVETIMVYRGEGAEQAFAASSSKIYNITAQYQNTPVVTGLTNARWQYVNFSNSTSGATARVIQCVNGIDQLQMYDGTTWTVPSITGLPNGLGTSSIRSIHAQKQRLWYLLNDSLGQPSTVVAFMPTAAIQGAINGTQDLSSLWSRGGYLQAMADWTIDGGNGPQDYVVFLSSRGQASIYQGTDPSTPSAWSLVGTFQLPPPIGTRCVTSLGSDVGVITQQGVLPLSSALPFDPSADRSVAITSRIQNAMSQAANSYSGNFGWQLISFPLQQLIFLNVPIQENAQQQQYVMNALTGAWCQFTGWNANCFEIFNNMLMFGDNTGSVNQGYIGSSDLFSNINADMQCAFNYFEDPGRIKRMTLVQPLLTASGNITPTMAVDYDFTTSTATAPVSTITGGALWDVAKWDVALWPSGSTNLISWYSVEAIGHALAIRMRVNFSSGLSMGQGTFDLGVFDQATFDSGGLTTNAPSLAVNAFNAVMENGGYI